MIIAKFTRARKRIITVLILPLLMMFVNIPAYAAEGAGDNVRVENPKVTIDGDSVLISYDLVGSAGHKYKVQLVLHRTDDPTYTFLPTAVSGDVGDSIAAGAKKKITWNYRTDFPRGLADTNFTFVITAEEAGSDSWLYYVAGAILAGGASALLLLKKGGQSKPPDTGTGLPPPPTRPG